jgi:hypothetical protein
MRCIFANRNNSSGQLKAPSSTLCRLSLSSISSDRDSEGGEIDECSVMVVNLENFNINNFNKIKHHADFL